jgi:hypothetical protein
VLVVMGVDRPVPRWSIRMILKLPSAHFIQPDASVGRGDSKPGPPGHMVGWGGGGREL